MKVLYNWLKEFTAVTAPAAEVRSRLSLSGTAVDAIEDSPAGPVLDAEITINRPDCLGHYGIAREVATLYRLPLKAVHPKLKETAEKASAAARVEVESADLCGRFTARVLRGAKVAPSPDWLRERLAALGHGSINNVVDATNYAMLELGHPLHAYDLDTLAEQRLVVRRARKGEKLRTLDGVERTLPADTCVIADGARAVGIGGVMGGAETEISFSTKNILLECAWFDPISIRRASKALGLRSEASMRFERGADPMMAELASRRCAELIQQVAGGEVLTGFIDVFTRPVTPERIEFTRMGLLRVMGADIPDKDIEEILGGLGFPAERVDTNRGSAGSLVARWECRRPSWRQDVTREIDLIEEAARIYGYDKFPARLPAAKQPAARLPHAEAEDRLRERLRALGYCEILSIPLVDPEKDALFRPEGATPAKTVNPLAEDASVLRSSGVLSMVQALEWNLNRGQHNLRLFEIGRAYGLRKGEPVETPILTLGATGLAHEKSVHEAPREFGFADLQGDLELLGELAGGLCWELGGPEWLQAGRAARMRLGKEEVGVAGQLARRIAERFKLRQDAYAAELHLTPLYEGFARVRAALRFQPLSRFPAVERDFSLVLADGITFAQVAEAIGALGIAELQRIEPVDLFRGGQVAPGKHSLLVRATFGSREATLAEAQIAAFSGRIVAALEQKLGATLRVS
ncbi:MAG TPA: phenylalanine--tRNA ligase subunit beta [Candidatus Acidoferrales bacterium]|jgi:phenylalanyl-tRNA synthetase beta chain|nr:phenylalanine--tRNA ligase subunit beta [Candidatus Acidoferrales bacterium]